MNSPQALIIPLAFLLLVVVSSSTSTSASVLQDTCKSLAAGDPNIRYDDCLKFFQTDKASATADKRGLAIIAARITGQAARSTAKRIAALKASAKDKKVLECLRDCADVYSSAVDETGQAARDIASGGAADLQSALTALSAASDAPETCEQGFRDLHLSSPMAAEDAEFSKEAFIAVAMTSALTKSA